MGTLVSSASVIAPTHGVATPLSTPVGGDAGPPQAPNRPPSTESTTQRRGSIKDRSLVVARLRLWRSSAVAEVVDDASGVVVLPCLSRSLCDVLVVQADKHVHQFAADR